MKIKDGGESFTIWLSPKDTQEWARGTAGVGDGGVWPCSEMAGRRVRATFDRSGLLEFLIDGRDIRQSTLHVPVDEFNAIVADFAATKLSEDHPVWYVAVGQFKGG
ncbi:MAG: hypothetical protein CL581_03680 [Alteromonadaceae bacterium]|nr:hypothetical protein [Alteromonadaceae bacterium]|tara:strand:+ start:2537 stop:2854 length:318 start_codon:yes stop_codon:yes gene_type:complete